MTFFDDSTALESGGTETAGGLSRRSLLRTGAIAGAWSIPLVQVVAAAPAHASSGGEGAAVLAISGSASWGPASANRPLNTSISVSNTGGQAATLLTIVLSFAAGYAPTVRASSLPTGWQSSGDGTPTVTLTANGEVIAAAGSLTVNPIFDLANPNNRGKETTVGLTVNGAGGLEANGTLVVPRA